jgi:phosphoribosylformylglycinamidine synthase PurS subunit
MKYQVIIRLKDGVLDVQGKAIENGLRDHNFASIGNVRVGKVIELDVSDISSELAKAQVEEVCRLLLVNPVIEQFEVREVRDSE